MYKAKVFQHYIYPRSYHFDWQLNGSNKRRQEFQDTSFLESFIAEHTSKRMIQILRILFLIVNKTSEIDVDTIKCFL